METLRQHHQKRKTGLALALLTVHYENIPAKIMMLRQIPWKSISGLDSDSGQHWCWNCVVENRYTPVLVVEHIEHNNNVTLTPPTYTYADKKAGAKVADAEDTDTVALEQP